MMGGRSRRYPERIQAHLSIRLHDDLDLGFTNATSFSPKDFMPLAPWATMTMSVQALISLVVVGLVIARAVNIFA